MIRRKAALTCVLLMVLLTTGGCAYRYYLGMHGPSIKSDPEIHRGSPTEDGQCLDCHGPTNPSGEAPVTSHPGFKGCLKCHNDPPE
jgi:hypothetical protein